MAYVEVILTARRILAFTDSIAFVVHTDLGELDAEAAAGSGDERDLTGQVEGTGHPVAARRAGWLDSS